MTPDTAALRALADTADTFSGYITIPTDTLRALCDAADEVERLRANGNGYLQRAHAAEAVIERMRCAHCGEVGCDWIGDIRKARAEKAEAQVAAVLAECRKVATVSGNASGYPYVLVNTIVGAIERAS